MFVMNNKIIKRIDEFKHVETIACSENNMKGQTGGDCVRLMLVYIGLKNY
jgi:hypothetical protein